MQLKLNPGKQKKLVPHKVTTTSTTTATTRK